MSFKIENNIIKVSKDCKTCAHFKVCKYHSKMSDLCNSNEFYGMNKYLEWNDSLRTFELNASCQFFELNYKIPEDKSVHLDVERGIIDEIIKLEKPAGVRTYITRIENNEVVFDTGNKETISVKITDLLEKYKFSTK